MRTYITIFERPIPLYALTIFCGLCVAFFVLRFLAKKCSVPTDDVLYALCYAVLGLTAGAKLMYVLLNAGMVFTLVRTYGILPVLQGGFVFYGGIVGAMIGVLLYARQFKVPVVPLLGILLTVAPLVQAFGRVGCFCAGCCYGREWHGILSVYMAGKERFPVQLLEAVLDIVLFAALFCNMCKKRALEQKSAENIAFYLCGYGVLRFICELFRGDAERGFWGALSVSSWCSIAFVLGGFLLLYMQFFAKKQKERGI